MRNARMNFRQSEDTSLPHGGCCVCVRVCVCVWGGGAEKDPIAILASTGTIKEIVCFGSEFNNEQTRWEMKSIHDTTFMIMKQNVILKKHSSKGTQIESVNCNLQFHVHARRGLK